MWSASQAVGDLSHQVVGDRIPHAIFRTLSANTGTLSATPRHSPPTHPHRRRPPLTSAPGPSFSCVPPLPKPCLTPSFRDGSPESALPGSGLSCVPTGSGFRLPPGSCFHSRAGLFRSGPRPFFSHSARGCAGAVLGLILRSYGTESFQGGARRSLPASQGSLG